MALPISPRSHLKQTLQTFDTIQSYEFLDFQMGDFHMLALMRCTLTHSSQNATSPSTFTFLMASGSNLDAQCGISPSIHNTIKGLKLLTNCSLQWHHDIHKFWCLPYASVVLDKTGGLWVTGLNKRRNLGLGPVSEPNTHAFERVEHTPWIGDSSGKVQKVVGGTSHTIVLCSNGHVYSCGDTKHGATGHAESCDTFQRIQFPNNNTFITDVACGNSHSIFLTNSELVWVCGFNSSGQCIIRNVGPDGVNIPRVTLVPHVNNIERIFARGNYTCIVSKQHEIWTYGNNNGGCLGRNSSDSVLSELQLLLPIDLPAQAHNATIHDVSLGYSHAILWQTSTEAIPEATIHSSASRFELSPSSTRSDPLDNSGFSSWNTDTGSSIHHTYDDSSEDMTHLEPIPLQLHRLLMHQKDAEIDTLKAKVEQLERLVHAYQQTLAQTSPILRSNSIHNQYVALADGTQQMVKSPPLEPTLNHRSFHCQISYGSMNIRRTFDNIHTIQALYAKCIDSIRIFMSPPKTRRIDEIDMFSFYFQNADQEQQELRELPGVSEDSNQLVQIFVYDKEPTRGAQAPSETKDGIQDPPLDTDPSTATEQTDSLTDDEQE